MRARVLIVLLVLLLGGSVFHVAMGQVSGTSQIGLGFSAGTVSPTSDGTPIFTVGDELWATSYLPGGVTLQLLNPVGVAVAENFAQDGSPDPLYNFSASDVPGTWELTTPGGAQTVTFTFVSDQGSQAALTGYNITAAGDVIMNLTMNAPGSFNLSACAYGSTAHPGIVNVTLPSGLGAGQLQMQRRGGQVFFGLNGTVTNPFTVWAELHTEYSYLVASNSTIVSRDMEVGSTTPVDVAGGFRNETVGLGGQVGERTGRYTMRVYFESSQGLSVYETPLLIPDNSSWISLAGCSATANDLAPDFSISASLALPVSSWPREVYLMYDVDGVQTFSDVSLSGEPAPAEVTVRAAPWGETLTDSNLSVESLTGSPAYVVLASETTVYLLASHYPVGIEVTLAPGDEEVETVQQGFSENVLNVSSGMVVVRTDTDGGSVSGIELAIVANGTEFARSPTLSGSATFYLPAGSYTVTGAYGNSTASATVESYPGTQSALTLNFGSPPQTGGPLPLYILAVTGLIGAGLSGYVWARTRNRHGSRLSARPQPRPSR